MKINWVYPSLIVISLLSVILSQGCTQSSLASGTEPSWSPDGQSIAFTGGSTGRTQIYVMKADGSQQRRITSNPNRSWGPSWSPDGLKIAFACGYTPAPSATISDIYVVNPDGSNQIRLTYEEGAELAPDWSPISKKIVFNTSREAGGGTREIYIMNADGSGQTAVTHKNDWYIDPVWSPDGTKIACQSTYFDIIIMNIDGSDVINLTNRTQGDFYEYPAWSPDGTKIAFSLYRGGISGIYVMNSDGTNQIQLTSNDKEFDSHPAWSPDGKKIAYDSGKGLPGRINIIDVSKIIK
jgi:Tol biopolymer transport system component